MRTPIIAGNWKMNKTADEAVAFVEQIREGLNATSGVDIVLCPPALAIPAVAASVKGTKIGVGAQNMYFAESGAFTGELAPNMLTPFCQYVILGHSERRAYFGETDEGVNKKIKAALAHGLTPMVCVGESLEQNEAGETHSFVSGQVKAAFAGLTAEQASVCVIAYEPIWAIGTGKTATVEQAGAIIGGTVRTAVAEILGDDVAQQVRIQYGGSVTEKNIAELMAHPDIDGALVGGASLKPTFVELVANAA
ncbi:MAG: triose-phosphate isomerase [Chloroflexi bacterium]|nr:triose-phosphate isomerase [Chloroflexota bacterium]MBK7176913.1 triose-phosphate isomerase [Chloroflexota bacterium]MBK7918290.1 triose-phosphate isomerase [Chloroflexota bacterium]MBK8933028.1 triose-phosphate isomerase [Chloroflexota bacterium]MBP7593627.1 triose-phosphate isomerase [Chloroflexota bacterium]